MWHIIPVVLAGLITLGLALFVWRRRSAPGAISFVLLMAAVGQWSFGYAGELASSSLETKLFWAKFEYLGIATVPLLWLVFALQYTGRDRWLSYRTLVLLALEPLLVLVLVWTNDWHGLIWQEIQLAPREPFAFLEITYGVGFWLHAAYAYLILLVTTVVLLQALARAQHLYRRQTFAVLFGALAPWIANLLYLSRATPVPHLDLTPFAFTITGIIFTWALVRFRLFDIVPIARDAILESMTDGVLVFDAHKRVVDLNHAAAGILGLSEQSLIGRRVAELPEELIAVIEQAEHAGTSWAQVMWVVGEEERCFDLRLSPLHQRGRSVGSLMLWRDMTERKRAEEAQIALIREQAARSRAEDSVRARDLFLSIASHELKTPLTALLGHTEVLYRRAGREATFSERNLRALGIIHQQALRLNKQIATLLDVSRIERGQLAIDPHPMDVCVLVRRLVAEIEPTLERHMLHVTGCETVLMINGDVLRLEQVLHNLLQNAIKYSPSGGLIAVDVRQQGADACIAVTDQGIGIPEDAQPYLFERFYRSNNVEQWQIAGLGVGLYVVKELVARHGGTIEVQSREGQGSTFTVRVPLCSEPPAPPAPAPVVTSAFN